MPLTSAQLGKIMPLCPSAKLDEYARGLSRAMIDAQITSVVRAAAFLGQLAHESGELRWWVEQSDGSLYEMRQDLGNTQVGDGPRYKGRGPIQLTGRANYRIAGKALGVDLENHPEYAEDPAIGFRVSAWYWSSRKLNAKADALDFAGITKAINGGLSHHTERLSYYHRALEVLGRDIIAV